MQRSDERERTDASFSLSEDAVSPDARSGSGSDGGVRGRLGRLFSVRTFLLSLALGGVGMFVGGAIPIVGVIGGFVGLFAAGFVVGALSSRGHYAEVALAGALASGLGFVMNALTTIFFPFAVELLAKYGVAIVGVGAGAGLLAMLVGHYFGRDLRAGLTMNV
ncbi:MAG: hypothetical protein ABEJ28_00800 [Salinigranum sp.]